MRKFLYFSFVKTSKIIYIFLTSALSFVFWFCAEKCYSQTHNFHPKPNRQFIPPQKDKGKGIAIIPNNEHLVNLFNIVPNLKTEWHYASINNFTGTVLYKNPKPLLVKPAAIALKKAADSLQKLGYGILLFDAYRPYSVSVKMWKIVNNPDFVADPTKGSNHNRGTAVDVSLYNLSTGKQLAMPTGFDDFRAKAHHGYRQLSKEIIDNRTLLKNIMEHFGYKAYKNEWWHYTFITNQKYDVLDIDFSQFAD